MRHLRWFCLVLAAFLLPPAAAAPTAAEARIADTIDPASFGAQAILVVHYHRPAADYADWNVWTWTEGGEGSGVAFTHETSFGRYAIIPVLRDTQRQGVILRRGDWASRDIDHDRFITLDADARSEVWLVAGDERIYTDPTAIDLTIRLSAAFLDASSAITLCATGPLEPEQRSGATITGGNDPYSVTGIAPLENPGDAAGMVYRVSLDRPVASTDIATLTLSIPGIDAPIAVYARDILTQDRFTPLDAQLGSRCTPGSTTFATWSPVSQRVDVLLYDAPTASQPTRIIPMTPGDRGLWHASVDADLHLTAYQYRFHSYAKDRTVPDIHCFAATLDSHRSVVVNLARTNPSAFESDSPPILKHPTDEVLYEVHVRDNTVADPSLDPLLRGTYLGLLHEGSLDINSRKIHTGLAHFKELGVTAIHLLPIQDCPTPPGEYNWGYWTTLFNTPESSYATNPSDPTSAITDLKQLVQGLHASGLRVILDVVYNHTSSSGEYSPFDQSVPYYYFRTTTDGRLRNDAGVGNSMADERPMVRKYITDSLLYWQREYHVDGFRFDLLGTHHPESVETWVKALRTQRSDLTIYGEPWTGGGPTYFGKGAQRGMGIAVFNDNIRGAIRGDLDGTSTGYATGNPGDPQGLWRGIAGAVNDFADSPTESINYISAHDNLTFYDKILRAHPTIDAPTALAMQKLAHALLLTSQGVPFLHAGSEFARTKGGNHNSYNAGDSVNRIDWSRKADNLELFQYVRGLIELRRAHPAFRMTTRSDIETRLRAVPQPDGTTLGVIVYTLQSADDTWREILIAANPAATPVDITLPPGTWQIVVNESSAGVTDLGSATQTCKIAPRSLAVMHRTAP